MTRTGLPAIGDVPWGSHFCQFYGTAEELAGGLVAFFQAGLENNEQCVWIVSEPLGAEAARAALRAVVPDLDRRAAEGQIDIIDFDQWYLRSGGEQDFDPVFAEWIAREKRAVALGYSGLRVSGNTFWVESREQWRSLADYEARLSACFVDHQIVAMCSYHLGRCTGADALEVIRHHQFAITCDCGAWSKVESASPKAAREELERRVGERTAQVRESERQTRELLEALPAAVYTTDAAGRITYYNQAAVELAGRRPTLGSDEWCVTWRLHWPDGGIMPHDQCPMAVALKEDRAIRGGEAIAERPDGVRVPFMAYPSPLHDASGALIGAVNMLVDVTERKRADEYLRDSEERLRRLNEGLEQRVREEVAARQAAQARLAQAQRMEALGQLAGGIAHDFNNVIQAVQGGSALIERRPGDAEGVRRLARMVGEAAGRGAAVTRRLLAFSRQGDLRAEPIDAASLLADMREILAHTLGTGIDVRLEVPPEVLTLMADKGQLETVLVNLATNARDAMPDGGTLTLAAGAEVLHRDGGRNHPVGLKPGSYVRLSVADSGIGMDEATLARVAEPFFTTKPPGKGTGLGLAMARGFAEQSGGGLHIETEPGHGTSVMLWLPVAAEDAASPTIAKAEIALAAPGEARARVLVVDDDAIVLETLAEQLEAADYAVLTAGDGAAALALLDEGEAVDMVISDLSMRGSDGVTLIREVHRHRPKLPAILLTGFATNAAEVAISGALSGAFSLLRKPIDGTHLAERVATLLEAGAARVREARRV
ncbi:MAG TPA: MEDS domain-containing protein [Acetobacteraceae bacterium]